MFHATWCFYGEQRSQLVRSRGTICILPVFPHGRLPVASIDAYPLRAFYGREQLAVRGGGRVYVGMVEAHLPEHFDDVGDDRAVRACDFLSMRAAKNMTATWYVTVELLKSGVLPKPRSSRLTSTSETEAEAKSFASAKLQEGRLVFAGTLNPVAPRRTVLSHHVADWVADE